MGAGGGGHQNTVFQVGHRQLVAAGVGEGSGLPGLACLQVAVGQPALQGVQVETVPVNYQDQSTQHQRSRHQESQ